MAFFIYTIIANNNIIKCQNFIPFFHLPPDYPDSDEFFHPVFLLEL